MMNDELLSKGTDSEIPRCNRRHLVIDIWLKEDTWLSTEMTNSKPKNNKSSQCKEIIGG